MVLKFIVSIQYNLCHQLVLLGEIFPFCDNFVRELGVARMVSNLISISSYWLVLSRKDEKCMINKPTLTAASWYKGYFFPFTQTEVQKSSFFIFIKNCVAWLSLLEAK